MKIQHFLRVFILFMGLFGGISLHLRAQIQIVYAAQVTWSNLTTTTCNNSLSANVNLSYADNGVYFRVSYELEMYVPATQVWSGSGASPFISGQCGNNGGSNAYSFAITQTGLYRVKAVTQYSVQTCSQGWTSNNISYTSPTNFYVYSPAAAYFSINGNTASTATYSKFCQSHTLVMNNYSTGTGYNVAAGAAGSYGYQWRLLIYNASSVGVQGSNVYTGAWTLGNPSSISIESLAGANGTWLASHTGDFIVRLEVDNNCANGVSARSSWIRILPDPTPVNLSFSINNGSTGINCNPIQTLPGCVTGAYSCGVNMSASTGYIEWYKLKFYSQPTCSNTTSTLIHDTGNITVNGGNAASLTSIGFNQYVIAGATGYFTNKVGSCYKVEVTMGNFCGVVTGWSYFKIGGLYRESAPDITTDLGEPIVYPNPGNDNLTVQYMPVVGKNTEIHILNVIGEQVYRQTIATESAISQQEITISTTELPQGLYIYQVKTDRTYTGKWIKE